MPSRHYISALDSAVSRLASGRAGLGVLVSGAIVLVWPMAIEGQALYFRDMQIFFVPMKHFLVESLKAGTLPFWNPSMFSGTPFFADMQTGILYPPTWLLLLTDLNRSLGILILVHLVLAMIATYAYCRRREAPATAACFAATLFGFGGLMVSTFNMINFMQALALVPVVLWCFEGLRLHGGPREFSPKHFALLTLAFALQIYAGAPDVTIMLGLILVATGWCGGLRRSAKLLTRTLLAGLLALAIASPQLLPTFELFQHSVRQNGLTSGEIASYALRLDRLTDFASAPALSPDDWRIFDVYPDGHVPLYLSLYVGLIPLALSAMALVARPRANLPWLLLGGLGLALATANPFAMALHSQLGIFRYPEKYVFLTHLAILMTAASGLSILAPRSATDRPQTTPANGSANAPGRTTGLIVRSAAAPALLLLVAGDLLWTNSRITLLAPDDYYDLSDLPEAHHLGSAGDGERTYARPAMTHGGGSVRDTYGSYRAQLTPHLGTIAGADYLNGTGGLVLGTDSLVVNLLHRLGPSSQLARRLRFFNARFVLTADPAFARAAEWRGEATARTPQLWDLGKPRPLAYFPRKVSAGRAVSLMSAIDDPAFGSASRVFTGGVKSAEQNQGVVHRVARTGPNVLVADVTATGEALIVLLESNYPGWQATVDGVPAMVETVNHFFMGIWIPEGRHQVKLQFVPGGFYPGLFAMTVALGITLFFLSGARWRPRGRAPR